MEKGTLDYLIRPFKRALHSPFGFQVVSLGFLMLFMLSFQPSHFIRQPERFGEGFFGDQAVFLPISEPGFLDNFAGVNTAGMREILVEDEQGNLVVKIQPKKRTSTISHVARSGDTISKVSHKFGLKVSTLLWANKLTSKQSLQVGQKLRIPPTDGIFYIVQNNNTLSEIAKAHNVDLEKIRTYNRIKEGNILTVGQELFIPDAKKIFVRSTPVPGRTGTIQSIGFRLRRPTKGILTQGFHRRHYAIDISNRMNTPIYSAASGKVIKSADGWNYGFGKYIVIDHGNGIETLYGHNNARKVEVGDEVKTGQLIALMGNSGSVWGPTGIHVHFELRIRGRKVNPNNYF